MRGVGVGRAASDGSVIFGIGELNMRTVPTLLNLDTTQAVFYDLGTNTGISITLSNATNVGDYGSLQSTPNTTITNGTRGIIAVSGEKRVGLDARL